ncbi:nudix hydrolase homolog 21 [Actinidia rufa]|uniref:Nudix hydrolase homolog 21 n=1 Tax=Actinidia rufa TaxID=165716 RepID=A0A7J0EW93_9ERIC|nr:nudix hydrolase homolog 21 [Actinidia rufa]GFZ18578.1 nudix hydrolase homolog 21 [Actinidia rufa]
MVALVSRTGRHLQRYNKDRRQVVGCIPYRYRGDEEEKFEVLLISSQRQGKGMLFPKGGWETDESLKQAALRETEEEAGVLGKLENILGIWHFQSKSQDAYMFPLLVTKQLEYWPEKAFRQRTWMSVTEAKEACQHSWMKEALDKLVKRLALAKQEEEEGEGVGTCTLS